MNETRIESLRFSPVENTSTGTITTLSTHDTSMVFFTGAGAVTIESISYGSKGKVLKLANLTGSTLTIKHNTGSTNKNKIITSDATDLVVANNQIATLLYDHVNSRWKIDGAASGGGGSAYPQPMIFVSTNTVLTSADQGLIILTAANVNLTLPATAVDGTTFTIYSLGNPYTIDTNGSPITNIGTGAAVAPASVELTLVAANAPGLGWSSIITSPVPYNVATVFTHGQIVNGGDGFYYLSKQNANIGNALANTSFWYKFASGGGGGKTVTAVQTGAYTAAANEIVRVDSTGAAFTVTLPSGPANGDEIEIVDVGGAAATNNITVDRATNPINGVAADVAFDVNYSRVVLIFSSALGWSLQ